MSISSQYGATRARRQRGLGLLGLLFVIFIIGAAALLTMRIVPSAIEYQAVLKAVERAKSQPTPATVRSAFDRSAQIDDIASITGKDLEIEPNANNAPGFKVSFAYRKELHLFGPASLVINYTGSAH
ncbi:DUF4845 domain-containing protein [Xylophilus sp. GOD-11R]|uniref:DUF4845 domain-containing protein n=1 Tax=Xylophilus sp. GOD-11R TaxID=3089814 RepID=UPI00298C5B9C|nr:DUF4845 domain-containing protein [Xylophilus sp. GOD-11R]WPB55996.1 DUF4845 domain-containing protein [Xylophilus sp. GOD-11R]